MEGGRYEGHDQTPSTADMRAEAVEPSEIGVILSRRGAGKMTLFGSHRGSNQLTKASSFC